MAAIALQTIAIAQNPSSYYIEDQRTFYGGLIAGVNFAQVDGDNFAGYDKVALNLGGIVYAQLGKQVAASVELLYSQKGSKSLVLRQALFFLIT